MIRSTSADAAAVRTVWRVDQYVGESVIQVQATQLDRKVPSAAERRRIFTDWVAFFSTTATAITSLHFVSRVPQDLLDAIADNRN